MSRHLTVLGILLASSLVFSQAAAEVYKRTNPDGSVEFSDIPDKKGVKPIEVSPPTTYSAPRLPKPASNVQPKSAVTDYESLSIVSPANDSVVRESQGKMTVKLNSKPGLQKGHFYVLLMDGKKVDESTNGQFNLSNIDRGSHSFIGQIVDENKDRLLQSEPVTVHLHRASRMLSNHPSRRTK